MRHVRGGKRWTPCAYFLWGCAIAALSVGTEALQKPLRNNFHEIVPGAYYRSGQPSAVDLERYAHDYGVCTVLNLRGVTAEDPAYHEECRAVRRLGLQMLELGLWAGQPPPRRKMFRLVEALQRCPTPLLIHCSHGADRTGLASAMVMLLHGNTGLERAKKELSLWYGHNPFGGAVCMDRVLDRYGEWLRKMGEPHSPDEFRRWVRTAYVPAECR
jgi:protein tyrosine/serine phosphatase